MRSNRQPEEMCQREKKMEGAQEAAFSCVSFCSTRTLQRVQWRDDRYLLLFLQMLEYVGYGEY
jgi:hypothetical protein